MADLVSPTGKDIALAPVRPSAGVSADYEKALLALVRAMSDDVGAQLKRHYARAESKIASDASPVAEVKAALVDLQKRWLDKFDAEATRLAKRFATQSTAHTERAMQARLKKAGITIKFRPTRRMADVVGAAVSENTKLIKSIASEYLDDVAGIVNRGIMDGHDLGQITDNLQHRYGVTRRRAAFIARQENSNATAAINRARQLDLGFKEGVWVHSGGGREPRPSHVKAGRDKMRFKIDEGAYLDGEFILPGQKFRCRCSWKPILKGFND